MFVLLDLIQKKICFIFWGLAFCFCSIWAEFSVLETSKHAERLFSEQCFGEALPLYSLLLASVSDKELQDQFTLRLASCYLEEDKPQTAVELLQPLTNSCPSSPLFYFLSCAHRQLKDPIQALNWLKQCTINEKNATMHHFLLLEKGYHVFHLGDVINAQKLFESISWQKENPVPYYLALLYLAKIYFIQNQFNEEQQILLKLQSILPQNHPLYIEKMYLNGLFLLATEQFKQASICFEKLLSQSFSSTNHGFIQVLQGLIISYLKQALSINLTIKELKSLFAKTEKSLEQLLLYTPTETTYLLFVDLYLIKAKRLQDATAYQHAQQFCLQHNLFLSSERKKQILLKQAEAAPSYKERDQIFKELIKEADLSSFYVTVWILKGLNDLNEGLEYREQQQLELMMDYFEQAIQAFNQAFKWGIQVKSKETNIALKYLILAHLYQPGIHKKQQAWKIINDALNHPDLNPSFFSQEIYGLTGWIALHFSDRNILKLALSFLQHSQSLSLSTFWQEIYLKLEILLNLQLKDWKQTEILLTKLVQEFPASHGEACFWHAYLADQQQNITLKKEYLQQVYMQNPQSPYAPIAYFQMYSYFEYMQGQRKAIKHLQSMALAFPFHPLLISAHYLIGLNHTKNQFSDKVEIIRKKDLTAAIEAFQLAESTFDNLFEKKLISLTDIPYFIQIRDRAQLERAQANFSIAQHSIGGKRQIYLEYAEEVFAELIQSFMPSSLLTKWRKNINSYPKIWAEAEFQLAKIYMEKIKWQESEAILDQSLNHYQLAAIPQGYGLMRVWYTKAKIAQKNKNFQVALHNFFEAEKALQGNLELSPEEKLDLWIEQSLCYKELNQLEDAMRLLSKVINDDVISSLRIKAMFLRAEIYEQQGRPELALKQLESTSRKGGEWAQKAQQKMEQFYGY